ncbi:MAG: LacI family DNA-binding transcriptional regulator [Negativicutes bacterium]|nr:LacI family DNA-binding transcriptional regulator [Negativicutes bacterium]
MPITIVDVARQAGVSKSTVSRYLNNKYECMSGETRERIAGVIAELDYHPNAVARSLKQKKTHTVGAIIANILNPFSTSVIRGIEDYCKKSGFNLILCNADDDPTKEKEYIEMLTAKQIDGLIINTTGRNNDIVCAVNQSLPVVLIDRKVPEINIDTVAVDNIKGAALAITHLVRQGYRRIAMFTLPYDSISPRRERVQGYRQALAEHGIAFQSELLVETAPEAETVREKLLALMAGSREPLAIFGMNNLMTMAIIKALKKMNVNIPRDIALLGFDDWEWAELLDPPITVVRQPTYQIGWRAATLLIKRAKSRGRQQRPSLVVFEPELVARRSCREEEQLPE